MLDRLAHMHRTALSGTFGFPTAFELVSEQHRQEEGYTDEIVWSASSVSSPVVSVEHGIRGGWRLFATSQAR